MGCLSPIILCLTSRDLRLHRGTGSFSQLSRRTRSSISRGREHFSRAWRPKRSQMWIIEDRCLRPLAPRRPGRPGTILTMTPRRSRATKICLLLASLLLSASACNQKMAIQPKDIPLRESEFFPNGSSARPLPDNTVPRGYLADDPAFYTGKMPAAAPSSSGAESAAHGAVGAADADTAAAKAA